MVKVLASLLLASLVSTVANAAVIGKLAAFCAQDPEAQLYRVVYVSDDQTAVFMADPMGALMTADSVAPTATEGVTITSAGKFGTEALTINNDGTGELAVTTPSGNTSAIKMNCGAENKPAALLLKK